MAKELPYFKFDVSEWMTGKIQVCSKESKGLFVDLAALYWSRLSKLDFKHAVHLLCNGNANAFDELIEENIVHVDDKNKIVLKFLDSQLKDFKKVSKARSQSARARWGDANALQKDSKSNAIRGDKRREEEIREETLVINKGAREILKNCSYQLSLIGKNSHLPAADFSHLVEQFILSREESGKEYENEKQVLAGLQKYINSASKNIHDGKQRRINNSNPISKKPTLTVREAGGFGKL